MTLRKIAGLGALLSLVTPGSPWQRKLPQR